MENQTEIKKDSDKNEEKIISSEQFAQKIKKQWKDLSKNQESGRRQRPEKTVTDIRISQKQNGEKEVWLETGNGAIHLDDQKTEDLNSYNDLSAEERSKVSDFIRRIREYGYAAVEGEIPADLKDDVLREMAASNISTTYKGRIAEEQEATEKRIAEERKTAENNAKISAQKTIAGLDESLFSETFYSPERVAQRVGSHLVARTKTGEKSYSVAITESIEKALNRDVKFVLPPVSDNISDNQHILIEDTVSKTADIAARTTENIETLDALAVNRVGSRSVTATTTDGRRLKGDAVSLGVKNVMQEAILEALARMERGEATADDQGLLKAQMRTLKHNGIIPEDAKGIPADKIAELQDYFRNHTDQIREKGAVRYLSEEQKKRFFAEKGIEVEARSEAENEEEKEKLQKLRREIAKTPTLLSQIISGEKNFSDYSYGEIMEDKRDHEKGGYKPSEEERLLTLLLSKEKKGHDPAKVFEKSIAVVREFSEQKKSNPELGWLQFAQQNGIISEKKHENNQKHPKRHNPDVAKHYEEKEKLLDPNNKETQAKIALVQELLKKEEQKKDLTEAEKNLLDFVHDKYKKKTHPERLTADEDLSKDQKALLEVLKNKTNFRAVDKERKEGTTSPAPEKKKSLQTQIAEYYTPPAKNKQPQKQQDAPVKVVKKQNER